MANSGFEAIHLTDIPEPDYKKQEDDPDWHAVRIHFGIRSFGANAYTAREAGGRLSEPHSESEDSGTRHEEHFLVVTGHATFTVDGEEVDAPAGALVFVRDPDLVRSAVAREAGTTLICFGGTPGEAFEVSPWERKYDRAAAP
jgi:mannose-6-phosphate isomerase-like protein (cupin superfamily)